MSLSPEQLAMRRTGISSSDVAAIVGLSPWETAHDVYAKKRGLVPDEEPTLRMRMGTALEDLLAELYTERTGQALVRTGLTYKSPHSAWMLATPDRFRPVAYPSLGPIHLAELKLAGDRLSEDWGADGDAVPDYVRCQCAWQMAVLEADRCDVAAIVGDEFKVFFLVRNLALESTLVDACAAFWRDTTRGIAPPVDGSPGSRRLLEALYHEQPPPTVLRATGPLERHIDRYVDAADALKAWEASKEEAANQIRAAMGEALADELHSARGKFYLRRSKGHERRTLRYIAPKKNRNEE